MKTKRSHVVIAILLLGVLFGAVAFVGLRGAMGYGATFHGSFKRIQPGMSEAAATVSDKPSRWEI